MKSNTKAFPFLVLSLPYVDTSVPETRRLYLYSQVKCNLSSDNLCFLFVSIFHMISAPFREDAQSHELLGHKLDETCVREKEFSPLDMNCSVLPPHRY